MYFDAMCRTLQALQELQFNAVRLCGVSTYENCYFVTYVTYVIYIYIYIYIYNNIVIMHNVIYKYIIYIYRFNYSSVTFTKSQKKQN
jgi:hypothetical protein